MTGPLIELAGVRRDFAVGGGVFRAGRTLHAVSGVSLAVARGEVLGLVGESGCGKSTLARMLLGLLAPSAGEISFDGRPLGAHDRRALARRVQPVFQDPYASLNPRKHVAAIIGLPLAVHAIGTPDERARRVEEMMERVGLARRLARNYPNQLSGGQRQRVAIARALVTRPEVVVCDEPTSALDVSVQAQILNLMRDLQDRFGLTYLFISHNLAVVRHMANRIGVMYLGRLVEVAPAREMFRAPKHPYTRMLLDAVPDLDLTGRKRKPVEGEVPNPIDPPPGCPFHPRCPSAFDRCRVERPLALPAGAATVACHAVQEGKI
jgi:peptide/nickel transport system ATP-binding protein